MPSVNVAGNGRLLGGETERGKRVAAEDLPVIWFLVQYVKRYPLLVRDIERKRHSK